VLGFGESVDAPADGQAALGSIRAGCPIIQPALIATAISCSAPPRFQAGQSGRAASQLRTTRRMDRQGALDDDVVEALLHDFVVHHGHAFGFDGSILACIDLEDGTRKVKGDATATASSSCCPTTDLLLVLSEEGELALVGATADQFTELARFPAIRGQDLEPSGAHRPTFPAGSHKNGQEMAASGCLCCRR